LPVVGVLLKQYLRHEENSQKEANSLPNLSERIDCHPDPHPEFERCIDRGCVWDELSETFEGQPRCYYPRDHVIPKSGQLFSLIVRDATDDRTLFDSSIGGFVYNDQLIQISTYLPSTRMYGFGEHAHPSLKHSFSSYQTWPMFARHEPRSRKTQSNNNLHGVHPFYMCADQFGKFHGVLFLNSNAQEITILPAPAITYRTIGGILEMYIFRGPSPADVIRQYWQLIGPPRLVPYWSLGFQLYQDLYTSVENIKQQANDMKKLGIPHEVHAFGLGHVQKHQDSLSTYPTFDGIHEYIAAEGRRWMMTLTPTISKEATESPWFQQTLDPLGLVTWPSQNPLPAEVFHGRMWNNDTAVFLNFEVPRMDDQWSTVIHRIYAELHFDGIMLGKNVSYS
uniref:P-type domain-containing protein n=1 Tax=Soboliphyme baturini TaxID=241478 RepID=A0A183J4M7_9BILA